MSPVLASNKSETDPTEINWCFSSERAAENKNISENRNLNGTEPYPQQPHPDEQLFEPV